MVKEKRRTSIKSRGTCCVHSEVEDKGELCTWFGIPDVMTQKADETQHVID